VLYISLKFHQNRCCNQASLGFILRLCDKSLYKMTTHVGSNIS